MYLTNYNRVLEEQSGLTIGVVMFTVSSMKYRCEIFDDREGKTMVMYSLGKSIFTRRDGPACTEIEIANGEIDFCYYLVGRYYDEEEYYKKIAK